MDKYLSIDIAGKSLIIDLTKETIPSMVIRFLSKEQLKGEECIENSDVCLPHQNSFYRITSVAVFIKEKGMLERIDCQCIFYIEASGSYCELHTSSGVRVLACSLLQLYKQLNSRIFMRVHRSYVINTNYITRLCGNTCYVKDVIKDYGIPVSLQYREKLFSNLNILALNQKRNLVDENETE